MYYLSALLIYYSYVIITIGSIGNICSCFYLLRSRLRHLSYYHYLAAMCGFDFVFLQLIVVTILDQRFLELPGTWTCPIIQYIAQISALMSQWCLTAATFERYVAVCHPYFKSKLCRVSLARRNIGVMIATACVVQSWVPFLVQHSNNNGYGKCDYDSNRTDYVTQVGVIVAEQSISYFLPCIVIVYCSAATIWRLMYYRGSVFRRMAHATPSELGNGHQSNGNAGQSNGQNRSNSVERESIMVISHRRYFTQKRRMRLLTAFIISIALTDTILNLQLAIYRIYQMTSGSGTLHEEPVEKHHQRLVEFLVYILYYSQYALNPFFFFICPHRKQVMASVSHVSLASTGTRRRSSNLSSTMSHPMKRTHQYSPAKKTSRNSVNVSRLEMIEEMSSTATAVQTTVHKLSSDSSDSACSTPATKPKKRVSVIEPLLLRKMSGYRKPNAPYWIRKPRMRTNREESSSTPSLGRYSGSTTASVIDRKLTP